MKISDGAFKHVESELYAYYDNRREIQRIKSEIMFDKISDDENVGGGKSNLPGDPTGRVALALAMNRRISSLELVLYAIESAFDRLQPIQQELIKLRYWTKPQTLTWDGIALQLNISRSTAIRWRDAVVREIAGNVGWK